MQLHLGLKNRAPLRLLQFKNAFNLLLTLISLQNLSYFQANLKLDICWKIWLEFLTNFSFGETFHYDNLNETWKKVWNIQETVCCQRKLFKTQQFQRNKRISYRFFNRRGVSRPLPGSEFFEISSTKTISSSISPEEEISDNSTSCSLGEAGVDSKTIQFQKFNWNIFF